MLTYLSALSSQYLLSIKSRHLIYLLAIVTNTKIVQGDEKYLLFHPDKKMGVIGLTGVCLFVTS